MKILQNHFTWSDPHGTDDDTFADGLIECGLFNLVKQWRCSPAFGPALTNTVSPWLQFLLTGDADTEYLELRWWGRYYQMLSDPLRCWEISSEVSERQSVSSWLSWAFAEHKLGPVCISALLLKMLTLLCWLVIALLYYCLWQSKRVIKVSLFIIISV